MARGKTDDIVIRSVTECKERSLMRIVIYTFIASLFFTTTCFAELHPEKCLEEFSKHCAKVSGTEHQFKCLSDLIDQDGASTGTICAGEISHFKIHRDCAETIKQHCANVSPGQGRVMKCLEENIQKASDKCRTTWNAETNSDLMPDDLEC